MKSGISSFQFKCLDCLETNKVHLLKMQKIKHRTVRFIDDLRLKAAV